ncbi:MAG: BrnT family toxin [Methyloversatilis discipulorum]|uniref:BrnT family toxin n=1 Tax=Methyloversatilis discipulorum TaxID=1119528 RepID=UPI0026F216C7|nr:BrnT family toxin [Methyloversatilis discipulorum]MBV5287724.1 BrnT family toxin [Methyloversatilis discipulorum]
MRITHDPAKRDKTLSERGLDFEDALLVFAGTTVEVVDDRKDYGERRIVCYDLLHGRVVVIGYTPRGSARHVFSMRKANDREQTRRAVSRALIASVSTPMWSSRTNTRNYPN